MTNEQMQFCLMLIKKQLFNEVDIIDKELGDKVERNYDFKYIGKDPYGMMKYMGAEDSTKKLSKDFVEIKTTTIILDDLRELINNLNL